MSEKQPLNNAVVIGVIVLVVLIVGYFVWTRSGPSSPTLGEGQSLQNPFGASAANDRKAMERKERGVLVPTPRQ